MNLLRSTTSVLSQGPCRPHVPQLHGDDPGLSGRNVPRGNLGRGNLSRGNLGRGNPSWASVSRHGFSLVELLVVMAVIAALAGMLLVAVNAAIVQGQRAARITTLKNIDLALTECKDLYNNYPPDMGVPNAQKLPLMAVYLRSAFPRMGQMPDRVRLPPDGAQRADFNRMDPAEAWVFALGGLARIGFDADGKRAIEMLGFSKNPLDPFEYTETGSRTRVLFPFQPELTKDLDNDGWPEYYPTPTAQAPIVYFRNTEYKISSYNPGRNLGIAAPYLDGDFFPKPKSFQLIDAGLDNRYGETTGVRQMSAEQVSDADIDNLTNWLKATLGESIQ